MRERRAKFTIKEILITVILSGTIAVFISPKVFGSAMHKDTAEALLALGALSSSMERCLNQNNNNVMACRLDSVLNTNFLDIVDPEKNSESAFYYKSGPTDIVGQPGGRYCVAADHKDNVIADKIFVCDLGNVSLDVIGYGKFVYLND